MGSTRPPVGAAFLLAALAVLLVGCGGSGDDTDQTSTSAGGNGQGKPTVTIEDYLYKPAKIVVQKGTMVAFVNRDSTPHTATSKAPGQFESGNLDTGETGKVVLEESGAFAYYCLFHPFMKGTIVVP